jgi:nucleotide-binding universal stress UspA family protein
VRLLVAFDGGDGGRDALELARVLTAPERDASALVATVLHAGPLPIEYALLTGEEEAEAEPVLEEAGEKLAGVEVEARAFGGGSPAGIITTLAEQEDFDAIVVGSPHHGPIGRVMLGSVAMSLLNGAPTDVAVAPRGYAEAPHDPLKDIAVGYDGSPEAKVALARAEGLARHSNARIKLLTVVTPPVAAPVMVPGGWAPEYPAEPDRTIRDGLASIDSALAAESTRLDGDPETELLKACEDEVDLLVLGSRGYGPLARALMGSVSRKVVHRAPCPVMVVRRP